MARHLRELGLSVTVVTSGAWGGLPDDAPDVVRVRDLRTSRPLRALLRREALRTTDAPGRLERPPSPLLTKVLVPEMYVATWLPAAALAVRRLLARQPCDCLVTTSPPESVHLLALLLGSRRPAWIADFRDGWTFEPYREPFPTRVQRDLDARLERRIARSADVVTATSAAVADDLARRLGAHAHWVPNGWDPHLAPAQEPPAHDGSGPVLVYTGRLSGLWGRDPEPLLRALAKVRAEPGAPPLRLLHAGPLTAGERELIDRSGAADFVEHLGMLDRPAALALQRSADALVLLTTRVSSQLPAKLCEYLSAGRPIVALAEDCEAERIVRETGTGVTVPHDDVDAIAAALRAVASGELARAYAPRDIERFRYPAPAERMAELVEEAIRRRASR